MEKKARHGSSVTISGVAGQGEPHRGFVDVARGFIPLCCSKNVLRNNP